MVQLGLLGSQEMIWITLVIVIGRVKRHRSSSTVSGHGGLCNLELCDSQLDVFFCWRWSRVMVVKLVEILFTWFWTWQVMHVGEQVKTVVYIGINEFIDPGRI